MDKNTNNELKIMIENLTKTVDDGFKGVHARQDKTNGKVLSNTEHRLRVEGVIALFKWVGFAQSIAIIGLVIKAFI